MTNQLNVDVQISSIIKNVNDLNNKVLKLESLNIGLQKTIEDQIESMVGIDKWFNTDNQHKNQEIVKTGGANFRKTWLLMDSNNIVYIDDYPLLFEVLQAEDRGDGTFAMPDFHDGTLRHIRVGDTRELGTFEMDAMQSHVHSNTHNHTANPHKHFFRDSFGGSMYFADQKVIGKDQMGASGIFKVVDQGYDRPAIAWTTSSWRGGIFEINRDAPGIKEGTTDNNIIINNTTITTDSGTGKQAQETRMKNTSGQWYILAKVSYMG